MAFPIIRTGRKAPDDDLDQLARIRADKLQQEQRAKEAPRREQQYQDQQDQAAAAGQGGGVQYTGGKADSRDAKDKQAEAGMKRQAEGDDLDQLARSRLEREKERKAAADELAAGKQKALAQGAARAGLGGFGLSGASATLQSDIGRTQDRSATLAMAQLDRGQRDEDFLAIQRQAALDDLEDAQDRDLDGNGMVSGVKVGGAIGDGDPSNDKPKEAPKPKGGLKGDTDGNGVISPEERTAAQAANKKEREIQERADGGLGAGVPMTGKKNADGSVTNTATNKTYSTSTMEEALANNWTYGGASFTADGKTYKVYTDAQGNKHAVEA